MYKIAFCLILCLLHFGCAQQTRVPTTSQSVGLDEFASLNICKMRVSNAPPARGSTIQRSTPFACVQGIRLLIAPAPRACLSSGYGWRGGRKHRGLDYQSKPAGNVVAAAAGIVVEQAYRRKDMGHWIVIDHGNGVYSGYAHLANVSAAIHVGERVKRGQVLGKMGNTGASARAVHLHYEVRKGYYNSRKGWWGLTSINLYDQPENC